MTAKKRSKYETNRRRLRGKGLSHLDIAILHFLWRWKLSTSAVLHATLAIAAKASSFNKRLRKLCANGFIEADIEVVVGFHYWQLTDEGVGAIREGLREPTDLGFRSPSHNHDRLVQTVCLKPWIEAQAQLPQMFTDQEMLKRKKDTWPSWVPNTDAHRPDAYINLPRGNDAFPIAIEVELFAKSASRYESIARFYEAERSIQKTIWFTHDEAVPRLFRKALVAINQRSINLHLFVTLNDFMKDGFNVSPENEKAVKSLPLSEILGVPVGSQCGNNAENDGVISKTSAFTDNRKFLKTART